MNNIDMCNGALFSLATRVFLACYRGDLQTSDMNKVSHGVTEVYGFKKIQLKSYLIFIVDITFIILDVKLYVSSIPVYCSAAVCIHGDIPLPLHPRQRFKRRSIRRFVIMEKAPTRAFSWLKAATSAFTFKTLLRHYAKWALTPL